MNKKLPLISIERVKNTHMRIAIKCHVKGS